MNLVSAKILKWWNLQLTSWIELEGIQNPLMGRTEYIWWESFHQEYMLCRHSMPLQIE